MADQHRHNADVTVIVVIVVIVEIAVIVAAVVDGKHKNQFFRIFFPRLIAK